MTANTQAIQDQNKKLEEAATHIEELETWSAAANNAFQHMLKDQKNTCRQTNDLESRSRINNLRIYGVPEGAAGSSVPQFVEKMLRSEMLIYRSTDSTCPQSPGVETAWANTKTFSSIMMVLQKAW